MSSVLHAPSATPIVSPPAPSSKPAETDKKVTAANFANRLLEHSCTYYQIYIHGNPFDEHDRGFQSESPHSDEVKNLLEGIQRNNFLDQKDIEKIGERNIENYNDIIASDDYSKAMRQHKKPAQCILDRMVQCHGDNKRRLEARHKLQLKQLESYFKDGGRFKTLKDNNGKVLHSAADMERRYHHARQFLLQAQHKELEVNDQYWESSRQNFMRGYDRATQVKALVNAHNDDQALRGSKQRVSYSRDSDHFRIGNTPSDFVDEWDKQNNFFDNEKLRKEYVQGNGKLLFKCGYSIEFSLTPFRRHYAELMIAFNDQNNQTMVMTAPGNATTSEKCDAFCAAIPRMVGNGMTSFNLSGLLTWDKKNIERLVKEILKHNPNAGITLPEKYKKNIDLNALRNEAVGKTHPDWREENRFARHYESLNSNPFTTDPAPPIAPYPGKGLATPIVAASDPRPPAVLPVPESTPAAPPAAADPAPAVVISRAPSV